MSGEIQRYDPRVVRVVTSDVGHKATLAELFPSANGIAVYHADHIAKIAELEREVERLTALAESRSNRIEDDSYNVNSVLRENGELRQERDTLRQQLEAMQWISVEERLPEPDKEVLVYCPYWSKKPFKGRWEYAPSRYSGGYWTGEQILSEIDGGDPTHWMPLPNPPAGGSHE